MYPSEQLSSRAIYCFGLTRQAYLRINDECRVDRQSSISTGYRILLRSLTHCWRRVRMPVSVTFSLLYKLTRMPDTVRTEFFIFFMRVSSYWTSSRFEISTWRKYGRLEENAVVYSHNFNNLYQICVMTCIHWCYDTDVYSIFADASDIDKTRRKYVNRYIRACHFLYITEHKKKHTFYLLYCEIFIALLKNNN